MSENFKKFLEFIGKDSELLEKAKRLKADDPEKAKEIAIAFAEEQGFALTEADFEAPEGELSADELNAVAGGGTCACVLGGGGTKDDYDVDQVCACVITGLGLDCDGIPRCICEVGGGGKAFLDG